MPQNQHKIKSEYAKSFKTYKESAQAEYSENVKFRLARRNQEVSHQPWAWLDIDLSDDDESDKNKLCKSTSIDEEKHSIVKQGSNEVEDSNSNDTNSNFDASGAVEMNKFDSDQQFIDHLKKKAVKRAMEMKGCEVPAATQKNQSNSNTRHLTRPHHPLKGSNGVFEHSMARNNNIHTNNIHTNSSHSNINSTNHNSNKNHEPKPSKNLISVINGKDKLFLSYGWGSRSTDANHKKTFNVKSDIDVYPSAIRASNSRETIKQQNQKEKSNVSENGRPRTARPGGRNRNNANSCGRSIDLDNRAAMEWLSEYQLRFPIYDNEVYRRGLANLAPRGQFARLDTPRTCRI